VTIYFDKRRDRWTYDFHRGGKRYSGYCLDALGAPVTSRTAAKQAEGVARRRAELEPKIARPGEMTLAMCTAALTPVWMTQANWTERHRWLKEILAFFGADTAIADIDQAKVDDYVSRCRTAKMLQWHGGPARDCRDPANERYWTRTEKTRAPATTNLYLGTLRQIFERAARHTDPFTGAPAFKHLPAVPELRRPKRKARPTPDAVAADIMAVMPAHIVDAMMLTALFGFRLGEVYGLKCTAIDWQACGVRLQSEDVKDAEDVFLPASQFAMGYLRCLDDEAKARGVRNLITWRKPGSETYEPLKGLGHAWDRARALMRAKYGRTWRWHDLRAAFITHVALTSGGVVAGAMARHSDPDTTQAYIEVADEIRRLAAERTGGRALALAADKSHRHDPSDVQFAPRPGRRKVL